MVSQGIVSPSPHLSGENNSYKALEDADLILMVKTHPFVKGSKNPSMRLAASSDTARPASGIAAFSAGMAGVG